MPRRRARPAPLPGIALLAAAVLLDGCGTQVAVLDVPAPAATAVPAGSTTTSTTDPTQGTEPVVGGTPSTTAVALRPGTATIGGTVTGPAGGVGGATVQIERFVGDQMAVTQVVSAPGGAWVDSGLVGGRYVVRAWKPPSLAMADGQAFFVAGGATHDSVLTMASYTGPSVTASFAPDPPVSGQPTTLALDLTTPTVSAQGAVAYVPLAGDRVQVLGGSQWTSTGSGRAVTGAGGAATFVVTCGAPGNDPLTVLVERAIPVTLTTPTCQPPPAPPTTTTTTGPGPTTTVPHGRRHPATTAAAASLP